MLKMVPAGYSGGGSLEQWGWEPDTLIRVPGLAEQLSDDGIKTVVHTRLSFIGSTLTRILLHNTDDLQGYVNLSDLWINLRRSLTERDPQQPLFVDVYWGGADSVGHVYGPDDAYAPAALHHLARSLEEDFLNLLPAQARDRTLLIVTADHGQIATPMDQVVHLPDHPALWETMLLPPAGESRASYLYVRPGQQSQLEYYTKEHLQDRFLLLDTERALGIGLWGPKTLLTSVSRARLGDRLLLARGGSRLSRRRREDDKGTLRGHHGSLTPEEMLVPLLLARLDQC
jgi:hypothetical protein